MEKPANNVKERKFFTFKNCFSCIISGIGGFTMFLITIGAVKVFSFLFHKITNTKFDTEDFLLAMVGFVLVFLIKFFELIEKAEKE